MRRTTRALALLILSVTALAGISARCIENVAIYKTGSDTILLGEIFNDTDVHGTNVVLQATLYDGERNVIAAQNMTVMCPGDLAPHSQSAYAFLFAAKNLPAHASYDVRPISGRALETPPPALDVDVVSATAGFKGGSDGDLTMRLTVRNNSDVTITPEMCGVTYDGSGKVRSVTPFNPSQFQGDPALRPGQDTVLDFALTGQNGAATVRAWLWFPGPGGVSRYLPVMTAAVPIGQ